MPDFPLNFTAGVRTFPILLPKCPESQETIIRHFCSQNMKTPINLLLNPIILAYLLLSPHLPILFSPLFSFQWSSRSFDCCAFIHSGTPCHTYVWRETGTRQRSGLANITKESIWMDELRISEVWTRNKEPKTSCLNPVSIWGHMSKKKIQSFTRIYERRKKGCSCTNSTVHFTRAGMIKDNTLFHEVCNDFIYTFNASIRNTSKI